MNKILSVFYITLLTFALSQNSAGNQVAHFATGIKVIDVAGGIGNNRDFQIGLSGSNFEAHQLVHGATSLIDFSYTSVQNSGDQFVTFLVQGLSLNPARTSLTIKVSGANNQNQKWAMRRATISYILIGQKMDNPTTSTTELMSTVFAKNSQKISLSATSPFERKVNFEKDYLDSSSGNQSPFILDISADQGGKCGAYKNGNSWNFLTKACARATAYPTITGFDSRALANGQTIKLQIARFNAGSHYDSVEINLKDLTHFSTTKNSAGLKVEFNFQKVAFVQISMVIIFLKQYLPGSYPSQGVFPDIFKVNTYNTALLIANSQGQVVIGPDKIISNKIQSKSQDISILQKDKKYGENLYGHRFFGLTYFKAQAESTVTNFGFQVKKVNLADNKISLSLYPAPTTSVFNQLSIDPTKTNFDYTFLLFSSKNGCQQKKKTVSLDENFLGISVTDKVTANGVVLSTSATYPNHPEANPKLSDSVLSIAKQKFTGSGTVVYTLKINANPKNSVYQGVVYFPQEIFASFFENVQVSVFGNVVIRERQKIEAKPMHFSFQNTNLVDRTIKITYNIQQPTPPATFPAIGQQKLQFGLIQHSNVLADTNLACSTACQPISGYTIGIDTSTSPPTCIKCETGLNQLFDPLTEKCKCNPGYYRNNNGRCDVCSITLCQTCIALSNACPQCVANAVFNDPPLEGCKCIDGFYKDNLQCLPCSSGCVTCNSAEVCKTCKVPSGQTTNPTRKTPAQGCACIENYYETGNVLCSKCAPQCKTCKTSPTVCETCLNDAKLVGTTCLCNDGYYFGLNENGVGACLKCYFGCQKCSSDAAKCSKCKTQQWTLTNTGQCICNKQIKYIYSGSQIVDAICINSDCKNVDPNCAQCFISLNNNGQKRCKQCNHLQNWIVSADKKKCQCMVGYYLDSGKCLPCGDGCQKCKSKTECTLCAQGANSNNLGVCTCPGPTYIKNIDNTLQCLPCDPNCLKCQTEPNICTQCTNGFSTSASNKCVCLGRKFVTPDNVYCRDCLPGCEICVNQNTCKKCQSGYIPSADETRCLLDCPTGYYNAGPRCDECSTGCNSCTSQLDCKNCKNGYYLYLGSCRETCPSGTFSHSSNICIACSQACKSCSGTPTTCTDCKNGLILFRGQCIQNCPDKFYYNGATCVPCSTSCAKCSELPDKCTECPPNQYLYENKCSSNCPTAIVGGVCTNICPEGQYLLGKACRPCASQCRTCSSASACTSCKGTLLNFKGDCVSKCPGNTLHSGSTCLECDNSCNGCSGTITSCIQCQNKFYRLGSSCVAACPERYYLDYPSLSCKPCDAGCQICTSSGFCSKCIDNTAPIQGVCQGNCGANCIQCKSNTCIECSQGYYLLGSVCRPTCPSGATQSGNSCVCTTGLVLHLGSCISSCPDGFVKIGNECRTCRNPCKTCSMAIDKCDSCIDGYTYDQVGKKCVENNKCAFGEYPSAFGQCRLICPQDSYYLDSACYYKKCPVGYVKNEQKRSCTKQTSDAGCSAPFFLQGSSCVSRCDQGFYPNHNNRVCEVCPTNCLSCSGPNTCENCNVGTCLVGNVCVIQTDLCPPNQNRYNDMCVHSCPVGTFPRNGFCVRYCNPGLYFYLMGCYDQCPTNLHTAEACCIVCPTGHFPNENNRCVSNTQKCNSNQFVNPHTGSCENCRYPCSTCAGTSTFCTNCVSGFNLKGGSCVSQNACSSGFYSGPNGGCLKCPVKCGTCSNQNRCTSCSIGFVNTGADCIPGSTNDLQPLVLQIISIVKSGNIVLVKIKPNIMPNGIPTSMASNILLPISSHTQIRVTIWIEGDCIFAALTFLGEIPSIKIILVMNAELFSSFFSNIGYSLVNAQVTADISPFVPQINSISIPPTASNSRVFSQGTYSSQINSNLNRQIVKSVRQISSLG